MGGAAVAGESRRVGIGAVPEVLDATDAGGGEARGDIPGKIEQGVLRRRRGPEESFVGRVRDEETGDEFVPDLVIRLADGGTERDRNTPPVRPAALHGGDGRFEHAGGGAAPAGMGRADHAGGVVGPQDGAPVGGGDAQGGPRDGRRGRPGPRARPGWCGCRGRSRVPAWGEGPGWAVSK